MRSTRPEVGSRSVLGAVAGILVASGLVVAGSVAPASAVAPTFTTTTIDPSESPAYVVETADLDGDGRLDVLLPAYNPGALVVYYGKAGGGYDKMSYPLPNFGENLAVGDADGDGDLDVAVPTRQSSVYQVNLLTNGGARAFTTTVVSPQSNTAQDVSFANVDGTGNPEIVYTNYFGNSVEILTRQADGSYLSTATLPTTGGASDGYDLPTGLVVADLTGDGTLDVASANRGTDDVTIFVGSSGGTFTRTAVPLGTSMDGVRAGDVDGDGAPELVARSQSGDVFVLDRTGTTWTSTTVTGVSAPQDTVLADIDADGVKEIVGVSNLGIDVYEHQADGTYALSSNSPVTRPGGAFNPVSFAAADLDGDGDLDFVVSNLYSGFSGEVLALVGSGGGTPTDTTAPTTTDDVPTTVVTEPATVTLTATDDAGGSGVASIRYTIGTAANPPADPAGSAGQVYDPAARPVLTDGQLIRYAATDVAGNVETSHTSPAAQVTTTITTPVVTGTAQVGRVLRATTTATPASATVVHRWYRQSGSAAPTAISGATASTYTVQAADAGRRIVVLVGAVAAGYRTSVAVSSPTAVVPSPPITGLSVRATGGTRVGTVRVAQTSLDDDDSVDLAYQWQRAGSGGTWVDLPGAAAKRRSFELPPAVMKVNVRVLVTATRAGTTKAVASAPLVILPGNHDATNLHITGVREVGERLTAVFTDVDKPDGLVVTYSWVIGGNEIRAIGKTITVPKGSAGKKVIVDVRFTAPGYHNQQTRSPAIFIRS